MRMYKRMVRRFLVLLSKRYYRTIFIRYALGVTFSIILCAIVIALMIPSDASAQDDNEDVFYKYYSVIEVEEGDTLWNYAAQYRLESQESHEEYIDEVKSINHLTDNQIVEGTKIVIPYYSTEYICSNEYN